MNVQPVTLVWGLATVIDLSSRQVVDWATEV
jgi:hypothetical protein